MKVRGRLAVIAAAAFLLAQGCRPPSPADPRSTGGAYAAAWNRGDARALGAFYADQAVLRPAEGGLARYGRADITGYLRALLGESGGTRLALLGARVDRADPDEVRVTRRWSLSGRWTMDLQSKEVWRRGPEGDWQVIEATWVAEGNAGRGAPLGHSCTIDRDCRALGSCQAGACQVAGATATAPHP